MDIRITRNAILAAATAGVLIQEIAPLPAIAGTSTNTAGLVRQGSTSGLPADNRPAITISYSGQTALRNFNINPGISTLRPNASIALDFGTVGSPLPVTYTSTNVPTTSVQLARKLFTTSDTGVSYSPTIPDAQEHSALRLEWHEQGSAEGLIDLINDQVGYVGGIGGTPISNVPSRGPSVSNPTFVNGNQFTGANTLSGHTLAGGNFGNTYDTAVYDRLTGRNLVGGQNRIQFAVGEFKTESFSKNGTSSYTRLPGEAGYGLGNPTRSPGSTITGLGEADARSQFRPESVVNLSTDKHDPEQAADVFYANGPWNTAGTNNIDSRQIAVTAVTYVANPGTGLYKINKTDGQWLSTAGRLQNGAEFNVVERTADAGQRIVPSLVVGVDPTWAVGENDDGNTSGSVAAAAQKSVGRDPITGAPKIRYSGKTAGPESRATIAQSRLAFGPLSLAEARGAASNAPLRTLDVDFDNNGTYTRVNFDNIVDFSYAAILISHYNTIKQARPDLLAQYEAANPGATAEQIQTWWNGLSSNPNAGVDGQGIAKGTGIKGDKLNNVAAFHDNIASSIGTAASGLTQATVNNPADSLFIAGFAIPQILQYNREFDGGPLTPNPLFASLASLRNDIESNYGAAFTTDLSAGSNAQTKGSSAFYAVLNPSYSAEVNAADQVAITAKNADGTTAANGVVAPRGNYLFGNFNQVGVRDYAAVKESLRAALSLRNTDPTGKSSIFQADSAVLNSAAVAPIASGFGDLGATPGWSTTANTKGDLIVLGDFNTDGAFDGKDVYLLARGASLSDNGSTDQLTSASGPTFDERLRNSNAKLNKNAALDYIDAKLNNNADPNQAFIRLTARANAVSDPTGANAFNKHDVNRDGNIDLEDARLVDAFIGSDYRDLDDQLATVVATNLDPAGTRLIGNPTDPLNTTSRKSISLVDVELTDSGDITSLGAGSDFGLIKAAVGSLLKLGDTDFDSDVDLSDLGNLATNYGIGSGGKWSLGDFDLDGDVDLSDLGSLATFYGAGEVQAFADFQSLATVPEPAGIGMTSVILALWFRRRRKEGSRYV